MKRFIIMLLALIVLAGAGIFAATAAGSDESTVGEDGKCYITVVVTDAYDETVVDSAAIAAQHYSYKGGPIEGTPASTPLTVPGDWQANATDEPVGHYTSADQPDGTSYDVGESGLHFVSAGNSGKADWFYFQPAVDEVSHVVHHDAVTEQVEVPCDEEPPPVCTEDMPCWDCETMGNKVCGPVTPPVDEPPVVTPDAPSAPRTPVVADTL